MSMVSAFHVSVVGLRMSLNLVLGVSDVGLMMSVMLALMCQ